MRKERSSPPACPGPARASLSGQEGPAQVRPPVPRGRRGTTNGRGRCHRRLPQTARDARRPPTQQLSWHRLTVAGITVAMTTCPVAKPWTRAPAATRRVQGDSAIVAEGNEGARRRLDKLPRHPREGYTLSSPCSQDGRLFVAYCYKALRGTGKGREEDRVYTIWGTVRTASMAPRLPPSSSFSRVGRSEAWKRSTSTLFVTQTLRHHLARYPPQLPIRVGDPACGTVIVHNLFYSEMAKPQIPTREVIEALCRVDRPENMSLDYYDQI